MLSTKGVMITIIGFLRRWIGVTCYLGQFWHMGVAWDNVISSTVLLPFYY